MQQLCRQIGLSSFEEIIALIALYRRARCSSFHSLSKAKRIPGPYKSPTRSSKTWCRKPMVCWSIRSRSCSRQDYRRLHLGGVHFAPRDGKKIKKSWMPRNRSSTAPKPPITSTARLPNPSSPCWRNSRNTASINHLRGLCDAPTAPHSQKPTTRSIHGRAHLRAGQCR